MKKILEISTVCFLLLLFLTGCEEEATDPVSLNRSADGTTIRAKIGVPIIIHLEGNPTTGFRWVEGKTESAKKIYDLSINYAAKVTKPGIAGAGGVFEVSITPTSPGNDEVALEYRRTWEDETPAETFSLRLDVSG